ncbi:MAG: DNA polymerase III subunit chi [Alphaproteobacteria bacterium]
MTEISFYHLLHWPLERALPKLIEKTLLLSKRAVVVTSSEKRVEFLGNALWSEDDESWLPHGSEKDGRPDDQPVWLTTSDENPNGADFLFLTDGMTSDGVDGFERCFELFDGNDSAQVAAARERWKAYKDAGHQLKYLQQTETGGWTEMAS